MDSKPALFIKICGITELDDARAAADAGADAVGFNFWRPGKRYITPQRAAAIAETLPETLWKVGVFVDEQAESVLATARQVGLTALQLHGTESPRYLDSIGGYAKFKAFRMDPAFRPDFMPAYHADAFLLDSAGQTPGGTGAVFDWSRAIEAKKFGRIIVAGGLTPENVAEAIKIVAPWGVDVAGGVERAPGKKDARRVAEFVRAARAAASATGL